MKSLLNNQECRIDNHKAGQEIKHLEGLHIHKTYKKNKKYSKAEIRIPLDGINVKWNCTGDNAEKLMHECKKALSDPTINKNFVDVVVSEMYRFNNANNNSTLTKEEVDALNRDIAEKVLTDGFLITDISYQGFKNLKVFGKQATYNLFTNNSTTYKTFIGKTRFVFEGKDNNKDK